LIFTVLMLPFGFGVWFSACMLPGYLGLYNYHGYYTPPSFSVFSAAVATLIMAGALLLVYAREPLWRVRSVLAGCLLLSARLRESSIALFACVALVLGLRLVQLAGLIAILFSCLATYQGTWSPSDGAPLTPYGGTLALLAAATLLSWFVRQCYRTLEQFCLFHAERLIRQGE
jgi:hypothetical protein